MLGTYHFTSFINIIREIHFIQDPAVLWRTVLEKACKAVQAQYGTYYAVDADKKELIVKAAFGVDEERLKQVPFPIGKGICGWVAQFNAPALIVNTQKDPRFNRAIDSVTGVQTNSILCVPIHAQNQMFGVVEIINRIGGQFGAPDEELLILLGQQTAIAYQNLLLLQQVNQSKVLLESLLKNLSGGLIAVDTAGLLTVVNPAAIRLLNLESRGLIGAPANQALSKHHWFTELLTDTLASKKTVSRQEAMISFDGGTSQAKVGYTSILISDEMNQCLGAGVIFQKLSS